MHLSVNRTEILSVAVPFLTGWVVAACTVVQSPSEHPASAQRGEQAEPIGGPANATDPSLPATTAPGSETTRDGPSVERVPADPHAATPAPAHTQEDPAKPPPLGPRIPTPKIPANASNRADGTPCSTGSQCASGICEGMGCEPDQGTCTPKQRACTRDLREYCGCDGATFRASGSCPGLVFLHPGPCKQPR